MNSITLGSGQTAKHTIRLSSIKQNAFLDTLSGALQTALTPTHFTFSVRLANPNERQHIATPLTGKIVELHPALIAASKGADAGSLHVKKGEMGVVLSVVKMENTVVATAERMVTRVGSGVQIG
ncbi:hypothetical protein BKA70DRAFT_199063 [Coprinopsis sp. MPI-PUGE-AT-0042]|nr:hypothetical protein BKA70DRAFT_199063 [Coprinopsis sp. MPI-PUGE-AT-0042]